MIVWRERPRSLAHFLNPALLALVIASSAHGYESSRRDRMPWTLVFITSPLVMHGSSRRALPHDTRTHLSTWIARNPAVKAGFAGRARSLVPVTLEGLRFGIRSGLLSVEGDALKTSSSIPAATGQLAELIRSAALVGRWLAKVDQASTAFALFGVSP